MHGIKWDVAVIWCNLYSEVEGLEPVYYTAPGGTVFKTMTTGFSSSVDEFPVVYMDRTKNGYRLPTEAEWEFAARGGDPTKADWNYAYAGGNTLDEVAWWYENAGGKLEWTNRDYGIHPVGLKAANRLGIYDMTGNEYEWCWDRPGGVEAGTVVNPEGPLTYSGTAIGDKIFDQHGVKGGNYFMPYTYIMDVRRRNFMPHNDSAGLRVVRRR
jgi:formylglycine-generating enzyme required for sulfatase activity